ncbi:MAG: Cys-tRNA(Pro) deacylase [Sulfobacillus thermosulfidooxidans]|uniref:Cys-tRNA(Pro)/Cys-tRNA(Cys) deacylase n=1 Tax=Sulfobacillus thermosulfidooxidans TaxID=28034 RepID=A0A2T2X000_SULTH|nr:MAG: Cys-tRNA(Pro) deacylase [Sulfobacillus thermosulfidooxidans]
MAKKTIACRILDKAGITYSLHEYVWSEDAIDARSVAKKLDIAPHFIFKTLVLRGNHTGVLVALVPGDEQIDLKKLARISGNKHVELVATKDLPVLTGYIRGGVSPLGMKKVYPCYLDDSAMALDFISISAGQRGLQIFVDPHALIRLLSAQVTSLTLHEDS